MHFTAIPVSNPDENGWIIQLESVTNLISREDSLKRYYLHNTDIERPIACHLETDGVLREKGWWLVMYRSYFVFVEKFSMFGPHRAKLFYRSEQLQHSFWIATLQIECFFESQEPLTLQVLTATNKQQWYQHPKEKLKPIPR